MPSKKLDEYLKRLGREVRQGEVDVEALIRQLVTTAVEEALSKNRAMTGNSTVGLGETCEKLLEEIEKIREAMNSVVERIEALEKTIAANLQLSSKKREPEWVRKLKMLAERMGGIVPLSVSGVKLDDSKTSVLEEYGLYMLRGARDAYIATIDSLSEFIALLGSVTTSDEEEAASKMGRFRELFLDLRRAGVIIYSSRNRKWVPQEELKRFREKFMEN